jgi:hypothetical protein
MVKTDRTSGFNSWPLFVPRAAGLALIMAVLASPMIGAPALAEEDFINADRPGLAEGSVAVGPGTFQIETGVQKEYREVDDVDEQSTLIPTLLRLGVWTGMELRVETDLYTRGRIAEPGENVVRPDGFAPVSVGFKYNFLEGDATSFGAIARVFPPSGTNDYRSHHVTGDLRLVADWDFAPDWSLNPNIGVSVDESDDGGTFTSAIAAATLSYGLTDQLEIFVDTALQSPESENGKTGVAFDGGVVILLGHDIQFDVSAGTRVIGDSPADPFIATGVSVRF